MHTRLIARSCFVTITLLLVALGSASPAVAKADVTYDLGLFSHYVWRGITVTDGPVLQPVIDITHESGFRINAWANLDLDDANDLSGEFTEVDVTLAYGFGEGRWSYEVGLVEYLYPSNFGTSSTEAYFEVGFHAELAPSFALFYDFDQVDDLYASGSLEHISALSSHWVYSLAASVGYAGEKFARAYGGEKAGLFNGDLQLSFDRSLERGALSILLAYTDSLDEDVLPRQQVDLWGGVTLSLRF